VDDYSKAPIQQFPLPHHKKFIQNKLPHGVTASGGLSGAEVSIFSFGCNHLFLSATALQDSVFDFALGQELILSINNEKKGPPDFQVFGCFFLLEQ